MANSKRPPAIYLLTVDLESYEKRLFALERRVGELEARASDSEDENPPDTTRGDSAGFSPDNRQALKPRAEKLRRGRRPRISPEDFAWRIDEMALFLEPRWSTLQPLLKRATDRLG